MIDISRNTFDAGDNNLVFYVGASRARFKLSTVVNMTDEQCKYVSEMLGTVMPGKPAKKVMAAALNLLLK